MNLLFDYCVALTNLYGVVAKEKVIEIYNLQNEYKKTVADIEFLVEHHENKLRKNYVYVEGRYFGHEAVFVWEDDFEQLLRDQAGKPYYIPEKEVLLRYKDDQFYEETAWTKKMYRFLKKYVQPVNVNSVEDVFYDVLVYCKMETKPIAIIQRLEEIGVTFPTKNELIQALNLITELYNHTRLWSNNGFTPAELFEQEKHYLNPLPKRKFDKHSPNQRFSHAVKKVGRNDPCPCGSGKKYKKCCLVHA